MSSKSASGTRSLSSYVSQAVRDASFDLLSLNKTSGGKILITKDCITEPSKYEFAVRAKKRKTISAEA